MPLLALRRRTGDIYHQSDGNETCFAAGLSRQILGGLFAGWRRQEVQIAHSMGSFGREGAAGRQLDIVGVSWSADGRVGGGGSRSVQESSGLAGAVRQVDARIDVLGVFHLGLVIEGEVLARLTIMILSRARRSSACREALALSGAVACCRFGGHRDRFIRATPGFLFKVEGLM